MNYATLANRELDRKLQPHVRKQLTAAATPAIPPPLQTMLARILSRSTQKLELTELRP